jgi:tRNA pseudouridine38-40 synthase
MRSANFAKAVTPVHSLLDEKAMHEGAQALIGEHDFSAFRGAACQSKSPFRFVEYIDVSRKKDLVVIEIKANAFVLHMVRNIVGVLLEVGRGDKTVAWVAEVLKSCDRNQASVTAPPEGLYFVEAHYPEQCAIPKYPKGPLFLRDYSTS